MHKFEPSGHLAPPVAPPANQSDSPAPGHLNGSAKGGVALVEPASKVNLEAGPETDAGANLAEPANRHHSLLRIMLIVIAIIIIILVPLSAVLGVLTMGDAVTVAMESLAVLGSMVALVLRREQTSGYILILGGTLALMVRSWLNNTDTTGLFFNRNTTI